MSEDLWVKNPLAFRIDWAYYCPRDEDTYGVWLHRVSKGGAVGEPGRRGSGEGVGRRRWESGGSASQVRTGPPDGGSSRPLGVSDGNWGPPRRH